MKSSIITCDSCECELFPGAPEGLYFALEPRGNSLVAVSGAPSLIDDQHFCNHKCLIRYFKAYHFKMMEIILAEGV